MTAKKLIVNAALAISMAGAAFAQAPAPAKLPAFAGTTLDGRNVRNTDLVNKPTLVSFFFATCVPCIKEAPVLNAFAARHKEINVLAITPDPPDVARAYVSQRHFTWPVIADAGALIETLHVRGYPTWLLVAKDGRILARDTGLDEAAMREPAIGLAELERWVTERRQ